MHWDERHTHTPQAHWNRSIGTVSVHRDRSDDQGRHCTPQHPVGDGLVPACKTPMERGMLHTNLITLAGRDPQMCPFGLSDCRVKPRRLRGRRGFTRQPESPNVLPRFKHHQNSTRRPPERDRKKSEHGGERGKKKNAKCWATHPSGPHPSGLHPSGPDFFLGLGPTVWAPTLTHTRSRNGLAKIGLAKVGLAKIGFSQNWPGQNWSNQDGQNWIGQSRSLP